MTFSWTRLTGIAFCFALITVQSFGTLVVLLHPPTDDGLTRNLTCVSEDNHGVLIWNENIIKLENANASNHPENGTDLQPKKPTADKVNDCAIWNLAKCLAVWKNNSVWKGVNSSVKPMSPVFDYRWEGFKEFTFEQLIEDQEYQYVGPVKEPFGTAVFSARGLRDVWIFLCKNKEPARGPCFWIIIGGSRGKQSEILDCNNGAPQPRQPPMAGTCVVLTNITHENADVLNSYEWRTFRLKWSNSTRTIQVFKDTEHHYFVTTTNNTTISTTAFDHPDRNFCVNLLVGLCPECILQVNLVDSKGHNIKIGNISGGDDDAGNGLPAWRSVKLNANLQRSDPRFVRLTMTTILNESQGEGRWAIDTFRMCESVDRLRSSAATIRRNTSAKLWPEIKCQKLSYDESAIVDTLSKNTSQYDTKQLQKFLIKWENSCNTSCGSIGKHGLICSPTGCTCDRGFTGHDCSKTCSSGYYGYNCAENCTFCARDVLCGEVTERCDPTCGSLDLQPPVCRKVPSEPRNLTANLEAYGGVTLNWEYPLSSDARIEKFQIRIKSLEKEPPSYRTANDKIVIYRIKKDQEAYTCKLMLEPMKFYRISVAAINEKNLTSSEIQVNVTVPQSFDFRREEKLQVEEIGTLINLKVPGVVNATSTIKVHILVQWSSKCTENQSRASPSLVKPTRWTATTYTPNGNGSKILAIDLNKTKINASSCYLRPGEDYVIVAIARDSSTNVSVQLESTRFTLRNDTEVRKQNLALLIISPIIAACLLLLLLLLFIYFRKRKNSSALVTYEQILPKSKRKENPEILSTSYDQQSSISPYEMEENDVYALPFTPDSSSISTKCFEDYTKNAACNGLLNSQYTVLPKGLKKSCEYGRLPQNMPKNRNKNLIAYDDNRVVLEKIPGDPHSDYINASYIRGYGEEIVYIATQGPKPNTINDFWRMVRQEGVRVICMLTNVIEDGTTMCEQYWPEVGDEMKSGDIIISNTGHQVFADYTYRTFVLSYQKDTRTVTHLHYTGWLGHGVPMHSQSFVAYLKKLVEILNGHGPVIIHCSAGAGRTGTIILCDMCVRQGIIQREINVQAATKKMYESRANMITTPQQYLFAHIVITESITSIRTQIPCTDVLPARIQALKKQLPSHIRRLNETVWQERALHSLAPPLCHTPRRLSNNSSLQLSPAFPDVVHYQRHSSLDDESNHINAVSIDGVKTKNQYLASQLPQSSDLPDLWRFIAERNIELVIILQRPEPDDPMFCDLMPGESILVPLPYIQVETKTSLSEEQFTTDKLLISDSSEETPREQSVTVLTCNGWGCDNDDGKPPDTGALVSLWRASQSIPRKKDLALVLCRDGVTGCGLYLALSFLLERMAVERECDVISAVRAIRRSRPEFVRSLEQFEYLYDAAVNYAECFQTYANFS